MIKLQAEINDGRYDLNLRREGEQVSADVAGRTYSLEVHNPAAGVFLLRSGTNVYHCRVETGGKPELLNVSVRGSSSAIHLIDPKRLRGSQIPAPTITGPLRLSRRCLAKSCACWLRSVHR